MYVNSFCWAVAVDSRSRYSVRAGITIVVDCQEMVKR